MRIDPTSRATTTLLLAAAVALGGCDGGDDDAPGPAFTQADLAGEWRYTIFFAGPTVATGQLGWARGTLRIDGTGAATALTQEDSSSPGTVIVPALPPITYALSSDGVVTATTTVFLDTRGKMNPRKTLFVTTATQGSGSTRQRLSFYQRVVAGAAYSTADVAPATFSLHQLASGASAGWMHARVLSGADGVYSLTDLATQDGPAADVPDQGTLSISADGLVTSTAAPTFQGFLSADKELLVGTQTTGANAHLLSVLVRVGGAFRPADLVGGWTYSNLAAGVGLGAWARGTVTFDASGTGTFGLQTSSAGASEVPPPMTLAVAGDGTVTAAESSAFHGKLTPARDVMVATETHEAGVYGVIVAIR